MSNAHFPSSIQLPRRSDSRPLCRSLSCSTQYTFHHRFNCLAGAQGPLGYEAQHGLPLQLVRSSPPTHLPTQPTLLPYLPYNIPCQSRIMHCVIHADCTTHTTADCNTLKRYPHLYDDLGIAAPKSSSSTTNATMHVCALHTGCTTHTTANCNTLKRCPWLCDDLARIAALKSSLQPQTSPGPPSQACPRSTGGASAPYFSTMPRTIGRGATTSANATLSAASRIWSARRWATPTSSLSTQSQARRAL